MFFLQQTQFESGAMVHNKHIVYPICSACSPLSLKCILFVVDAVINIDVWFIVVADDKVGVPRLEPLQTTLPIN